jgi:O-antigen biosynthesis protein
LATTHPHVTPRPDALETARDSSVGSPGWPSGPVRLVDVDLDHPDEGADRLRTLGPLQGLVRIHGTPIGWFEAPAVDDRDRADQVLTSAVSQAADLAIRHLLMDLLATPSPPTGWRIRDLLDALHPDPPERTPAATVAICTRDRPLDLARCLGALRSLDYSRLEVVIVDNAPTDDTAERLVLTSFPEFRYVREPRPGLDWARNRAIAEASGEIICFTDDDAIVDPGWVGALARTFVEYPHAMSVTGPVVPAELETEAQVCFERYGGFGRGFLPIWASVDRVGGEGAWHDANSGKFGTGANMAFRRDLFEQIDGFDPALDVGTPTNGGGDLDMLFRVLKEGHELVYEPSALVRHRHRREYRELQRQITGWGSAFVAHLISNAIRYPGELDAIARVMAWWLHRWIVRRWLSRRSRRPGFPRELILCELLGGLSGPLRYVQARCIAARVARRYGPLPSIRLTPNDVPESANVTGQPRSQDVIGRRDPAAVAVRTVDLASRVSAIEDVVDYAKTLMIVLRHDRPIGWATMQNRHRQIVAPRVRAAIAEQLGPRALVTADRPDAAASHVPAHLRPLADRLVANARPAATRDRPLLRTDLSVSIVIATLDRPDDLRRCLQAVLQQATSRAVEVIVVDNNPTSGLTPPVVAEFVSVRLVQESRRGLAYARNAGILASSGDIVVATDDDVTAPPSWLERLVAPFTDPGVMAVTGNVLPLELETAAQRLFELYGGLGRGFERRRFDRAWFTGFTRRAVPTWEIGATANAAFRASIFEDPEIGLLEEALGPGMPSGVGEDTYQYYKILNAGYLIVYEPDAYVWHRHRRDSPALRRQLYGYSKGHVAYHLTTLFRDGDRRALWDLTVGLPRGYVRRTVRWLRGRRDYPLSLILVEIAGNLMGASGLWLSHRRVARERSAGSGRVPQGTPVQEPVSAAP